MANSHPNTMGLKPFNQMTVEEQKKIRSAGGKASVARRKRLKIQNEIIDNIRKQFVYDPISIGYYHLLKRLAADSLSMDNTMRLIDFFEKRKIEEARAIDESIDCLSEKELSEEMEISEVEKSIDTNITKAKSEESSQKYKW